MSITQRVRHRIVAGIALVLLSAALATARAKDPALLTLSAEHFKETASVTDDPATGIATVSTEPGFVEHSGPLRMVWHDEFLRGVIDRKTGQQVFQVAVLVIYPGSQRAYETARYSTAQGPRSVPTTLLERKVENCAVGDCTYTERVAFPVDAGMLRQLAAGGLPGKPNLWHYELIAKSGPSQSGALSSAEIEGFMTRVDATVNAVPVVAAKTLTVAPQRDLGIEGIAVAATAEQPDRAGILIAAVKSGTVAQKAGMITGDIVYEVDGHPTRTLAALQSAVAAGAADSRITLRLYRGTNSMTLTAQF